MAETPYAESARGALRTAARGATSEAAGAVCLDGGAIAGLVLCGEVAGTRGAGKLHAIVVRPASRRRGIATRLCGWAIDALRTRGARFVLAELPDDPALAPGLAFLARCGFREEGRVPDFYRDGVALLFLRRDLTG